MAVKENFEGQWLVPPEQNHKGLIVYVPGGSFTLGPSPRVMRVMKEIAERSELALLMPPYRLAPEHPCPAAVEDIAKVLQNLIQMNTWPKRIVLIGEQVGSNLILAALQKDIDRVAGEIAAMVFFSPWLDLSLSSWRAITVRMGAHSVHSRAQAELAARFYLGMNNPDISPMDPLASPLYGTMQNIPPVMIHASESDITLDDAKVFVEKIQQARPNTELHIWPRVAHMWERYELDYCQESIQMSTDFLLAHLP